MGIKDINQLLKESNFKDKASLDSLENRRIAIDAFNWIYTYMSCAFKSVLFKKDFDFYNDVDERQVFRVLAKDFLNFLKNLLDVNITPVLIWDGEHPISKTEAKLKRRAERAKRIEECNILLEQLKSKNGNSRNFSEVKIWKDKFCQNSRLEGPTLMALKDIAESLGVPSIQAPGDAEKLCAEFNRRGLVAGVWSRDTDLYALGSPCIITQIDFSMNTFDYIDGSKILTFLNLESDEFLDLCIMCGCDFNDRIKGIGPKKSLKFIQEYKKCENIPKINIDCLNLQQCRELLTVSKIPFNVENQELKCNPDKFESGKEILSFYSIEYMHSEFHNSLVNCQEPLDIIFE